MKSERYRIKEKKTVKKGRVTHDVVKSALRDMGAWIAFILTYMLMCMLGVHTYHNRHHHHIAIVSFIEIVNHLHKTSVFRQTHIVGKTYF